jgi:hypothetical protein
MIDTRALHGAPVNDESHAIPVLHAVHIPVMGEEHAGLALVAQKQLGFLLAVHEIDAE